MNLIPNRPPGFQHFADVGAVQDHIDAGHAVTSGVSESKWFCVTCDRVDRRRLALDQLRGLARQLAANEDADVRTLGATLSEIAEVV